MNKTPMDKPSFVYIMTNPNNTVLYTGMTCNIVRRIEEHKAHSVKGFTQKYHCTKLVYIERTETAIQAIEREKQIKGWSREKKANLVHEINPLWDDLNLHLLL